MEPMVHDPGRGEFSAASGQVRNLSDIDLPVVDRHRGAAAVVYLASAKDEWASEAVLDVNGASYLC